MYEVIILGATFAAAGIARRFKENCLVIEGSTRAGYEFFGALNFGCGYHIKPKTHEALSLQSTLIGANGNIYGGDRCIYPYFQEANILFSSHIVSVQQQGGCFVCQVHGVNGFASYRAKAVIDTRCNEGCSLSKTYNLMIESENTPSFPGLPGKKTWAENHYIISCPVPLQDSFTEARLAAMEIMNQFSETQRLILSADVFDYQVKPGYPKTESGILYLPSKAYKNPVLAFEAGYLVKEEHP